MLGTCLNFPKAFNASKSPASPLSRFTVQSTQLSFRSITFKYSTFFVNKQILYPSACSRYLSTGRFQTEERIKENKTLKEKKKEKKDGLQRIIDEIKRKEEQLRKSENIKDVATNLMEDTYINIISNATEIEVVDYIVVKVKKMNNSTIPLNLFPSVIRSYAKFNLDEKAIPLFDLFEKALDESTFNPNIEDTANTTKNDSNQISIDEYEKLYYDISIQLCKSTLGISRSLQLIKALEKRDLDCHPSFYFSLFNWALTTRDFANAEAMLTNQTIFPDLVVITCYKKLLSEHKELYDEQSANRIQNTIEDLIAKLPSDLRLEYDTFISPTFPSVKHTTYLENESRKLEEHFLTNLFLNIYK